MVDSCADPISRPFFWLLADNSIALGRDSTLVSTFTASLKHALLFHEEVLLSDALVVNTPNFRRVIQLDESFREYLTKGSLRVARRIENGQLTSLVDLRDRYRRNGSENIGFKNDPRLFTCDNDLLEIERHGSLLTFDQRDSASYYKQCVEGLVYDDCFLSKIGSDRDHVCKAILSAVGSDKIIDHTFFSEKKGELGDLIGQNAWTRITDIVSPYKRAFYYNSIPYVVGADIIFSEEHEPERNIIRGVGDHETRGVNLSRKSKSLYEAVLVNMSAEKLAKIRNSTEFSHLQTCLGRLRRLEDINDTRLQDIVTETYVALESYHRYLDSKLSILRFFAEGSAALDRWHLVGLLKGGSFLLRLGSKAISDSKIRVAITSSLAEWMHPGASQLVVVYYAVAGRTEFEKGLDKAPAVLARLERESSIRRWAGTVIDANIDLRAPRDTVYSSFHS